jgi:hypothetical protein
MPVADFGRCLAASSTAPAANAQGGGIAPRQAQAGHRSHLTAKKLSTWHYIGKSLIHMLSYRLLTISI